MKKISALMKKLAMLGFLSFIGCATFFQTEQTSMQKILVLSDPPGERIEMNDGYIGKAPIEVWVWAFRGLFAQTYTFTATPIRGRCTAFKMFSGSVQLPQFSNPVPEKILLNTRLCPDPNTPIIFMNTY